MKRILEAIGWLTAVALFAFAGYAVFGSTASAHALADAQDKPRATPNAPSGGERRGGGGARKAGPRENLSPVSILREARTIYVRPTQHLDKKYLEYKLQKYRELQDWGLMLVTEERAADLVKKIRDVRASSDPASRRKRPRADEDDEEEDAP
ncbi:MAG: hypothetical protein LC802_11150 [Acidobacteria bacterium]|nr:hypothetical protein [Acidobacteriota bacterium]